jgi:hypothetical protein
MVPSALAEDRHMVVEGLLKDDAGAVLEGDFQVTVSLYAAQDSVDAAWTETLDALTVKGGFFQARLGMANKLEAGLFQQNAGLWIGVALEGQPEFPRTSLETDPYAYRAMSAASADALSCTGCVDQSHLGFSAATGDADGAALSAIAAISADVAGDVQCTGCIDLTALEVGVLAASNVSFDDTASELGADTVQSALDKLKALVDEGGGGSGKVNEGNGTIVPYNSQWGLPSYGTAVEYVHLMNPSAAKVLVHLYGGEATGFAGSNNLIVSNTYAPNAYSGGVNGDQGSDTVNVTNAGEFNIGDHILIHQTVGNSPGHWELNAVKAVTGTAITLAKPLEESYKSATGNTQERAQIVIAASYNQLEIVNGGTIRPSMGLTGNNDNNLRGGIVYLRAQSITLKSGGKIEASGNDSPTGSYGGFYGGDNGNSPGSERGQSECSVQDGNYSNANNCSGGGGGRHYTSTCSHGTNAAGAGGGNKTAGENGKGGSNVGTGGAAKGSADAATLEFGGGGGYGAYYWGGRGGGIVVLGAKTIIVETGATISANGSNGSGSSSCRAAGGGGAGGSVLLFAKTVDNQGTIEAKGGNGGDGYSSKDGGDGGEGWVIEKEPVPGVVNQSYATGVEIWVDGQEVTAAVGDPNGKGEPHWGSTNKKWGATGTDAWSTGPLDLTNVANWTLGEHKLEFKETGGAGGDLKAYTYVIYPFTENSPPTNNTCGAPILLDPNTEPVVVSGTTEDVMGKTLASDDSKQEGCGGDGGPDVVYKIELAERSLIHANVVAPFASKLYIRSDNCATGDMMYCAENELTTTPFEPGDYYLFVDSDLAAAKGNFTLGVSTTKAPLPTNDTCATAMTLNFGADGLATHSGTTLYGLDQYKGSCPAPNDKGADAVYEFDAGTGQTLQVDITADFDALLYVTTMQCGKDGFSLGCNKAGSLTMQGLNGGKYWLYVDGSAEKEWGTYNLSVSLTTPGQ